MSISISFYPFVAENPVERDLKEKFIPVDLTSRIDTTTGWTLPTEHVIHEYSRPSDHLTGRTSSTPASKTAQGIAESKVNSSIDIMATRIEVSGKYIFIKDFGFFLNILPEVWPPKECVGATVYLQF